MIKGVDISSYEELKSLGVKYYNCGKEQNLFEILKSYNINSQRFRIWNDPYSKTGSSFGAGCNDFQTTMKLIKQAKFYGNSILLDFHYSDFWADPGKQYLPKAWQSFALDELEDAVYNYTLETLQELKKVKLLPEMVQIGNEISNGLLWPFGKTPNYQNIAKLISAGIRAVREVSKSIEIMLHLDNGGNNELYRSWFDKYFEYGEDFDLIGLSYYPFWHGTMNSFEKNMQDIVSRYGKDLIVAEVSMGHTMEDYADYEKLDSSQRKGMATKPELVAKIEHEMTIEGQTKFITDFLHLISRIKNKKCRGFYYWEPAWIPMPGSGWANNDSLQYINDEGPGGNEWANQCLFDYNGNVLPALEVIKNFKIE